MKALAATAIHKTKETTTDNLVLGTGSNTATHYTRMPLEPAQVSNSFNVWYCIELQPVSWFETKLLQYVYLRSHIGSCEESVCSVHTYQRSQQSLCSLEWVV